MNKCCICLEEGKLKICTKCKHAGYCDNCLNNLHEKNLDTNCPVCRQINWKPKFKKKSKKSNKIKPIENSLEILEEDNDKCFKINCNIRHCVNSIHFTLDILKIITLAFGIGIITLYVINPNNDFILKFLWLSPIIGLLEMLILFSCITYCLNKCFIIN